MDGRSSDGGVDVLHVSQGLARWRSEPDRGQSHAINEGLAEARGAFGSWLNADDWFLPGVLGEVAAFLRSNPETDLLVCRARFVAEDGRVAHTPIPPERIDEASLLRLRSGWFAGHSIAQPEAFFRLDMFRAAGGLDENNHHSMDHHLWLKLIERGARVRQLETVVACQGVHAGQKTADRLAATDSIVRSSRAWFDRRRSHWPLRADEIEHEIRSLEQKLARARRYVDAIDHATNPNGTTIATHSDSIPIAAAPKGWEHALGSVIRESASAARDWLIIATGPERTAIPNTQGLDSCRQIDAEAFAGVEPGTEAGILLHRALGLADDPLALLRAAAAAIRPGGTLVISCEPEASAAHRQYIARLRNRAVNKITQPDDFVIGPRADPTLVPMLRIDESTEPALHPHPLGIEIDRLLADAGLPGPIVAEHRFGWFDLLPLAPFPSLPKVTPHGPDGARHNCWLTCAIRTPH